MLPCDQIAGIAEGHVVLRAALEWWRMGLEDGRGGAGECCGGGCNGRADIDDIESSSDRDNERERESVCVYVYMGGGGGVVSTLTWMMPPFSMRL